ncbi:hypothetical protein [Paracoccus laeviglucosivorans]|uniref:Uncharacterized protein n=1 Tax=Paracoccus laeviglucosivorans TaxID=1197861 RepID=A0A521FV67_9RHOB|nr:hypothetical protein [Paracoccus laeviglucosivorans]SMP00022.1 hypothetical protein SAMN06265221_1563 [Paracoccus laeviglucosivorans]
MFRHLLYPGIVALAACPAAAQEFPESPTSMSQCYEVYWTLYRAANERYQSVVVSGPNYQDFSSYSAYSPVNEHHHKVVVPAALSERRAAWDAAKSGERMCLDRFYARRDAEQDARRAEAEARRADRSSNTSFISTEAAVGSAPGMALAKAGTSAGAMAIKHGTASAPYLRAQLGTVSILNSLTDLQQNWGRYSGSERILSILGTGNSLMRRFQSPGTSTTQGNLSGFLTSFALDYLTGINAGAMADLDNAFASFSGTGTYDPTTTLVLQIGQIMLQPDDEYAEKISQTEMRTASEKRVHGLASSEAMKTAAAERAAKARAAAKENASTKGKANTRSKPNDQERANTRSDAFDPYKDKTRRALCRYWNQKNYGRNDDTMCEQYQFWRGPIEPWHRPK